MAGDSPRCNVHRVMVLFSPRAAVPAVNFASMESEPGHPRFASRGRAYVYVLPCRDEDALKVGFSRDPFTRFHDLHRRFFDFFDLDRGMLVAVDYVKEARRIERALIKEFAGDRCMAPLVVREAAAGKTEWYRGVSAAVHEQAARLAGEGGHPVTAPLRPWLLDRIRERADALYDWSGRLHDMARDARVHGADASDIERVLLDTLDMCDRIGLAVDAHVSAEVARWYRFGGR